MHRSRLSVLVLATAVAACSKGDASESPELLAQDSTLAAQIAVTQESSRPPVPYDCSAVTIGAPSTDASASAPADATTDCRHVAPASGEARRPATATPRSHVQVSSGSVGESAPEATPATPGALTQAATRESQATEPRAVAGATTRQAEPAMTDASSPAEPVRTAPAIDTTVVVRGEAREAATARREPAAQQPEADQPAPDQPAARTERRTTSRARSGGIGAVTGAIIGAVTGRSVKSAVIGATAGGVIGTVMGDERP